MYQSYFCFENQKHTMRRVQCMDGNIRILVVDLFNAARNTNRNRVLKKFEEGTVKTVAEYVCPKNIDNHKKQFTHYVCKSKLIDETQAMTILKRMESTHLTESLKEFLSVFFSEEELNESKDEAQDETMNEIQDEAEDETKNETKEDEYKNETKNGVSLENFNLDTEKRVLCTQFGNIEFSYDVNKEPIFRAVDVTRALGYEDSDQAIRNYVDEKYCIAVAYTKSSATETEARYLDRTSIK